MTFEEKGAYMELLMLQFNRGHMTSHMIGQTVGQLWVKVQVKFIKDAEGLWYNERLEAEKEKRKSFTMSRRNNLSGENQYSKKKKTKKKQVGHMTSHMENVNVNENRSVNKNENLVFPFDSEKFKTVWKVLSTQKKWKNKSFAALQMSLKKLSEHSEPEAIKMIESAIAGEWQGIHEIKSNHGSKQEQVTKQNEEQFHRLMGEG